MSISEYDLVYPLSGRIGDRFTAWATSHAMAAARLVGSLDDFAATGGAAATCAAAGAGGTPEIYLVPPRHILAAVPDAAFLVRVDHGGRSLEIVELLPVYGGAGEGREWDGLVVRAQVFI
jgi:hypothetical protein